jgi:hypothetical protein
MFRPNRVSSDAPTAMSNTTMKMSAASLTCADSPSANDHSEACWNNG